MEMATSKEETWSACERLSDALHDTPSSIGIPSLATSLAHPSPEHLPSQFMILAIYGS
jgi:hypothetical protein